MYSHLIVMTHPSSILVGRAIDRGLNRKWEAGSNRASPANDLSNHISVTTSPHSVGTDCGRDRGVT